MPRAKKAELSPAVGTVNAGRKSGNPDFVSSSFYVPKRVNIRFNQALLTLNAAGFDVDRSDILAVLMDRFAIAVGAAEQQGGDLDLEAILATASDGSLTDSADVSVLKQVMRASIDEIKENADRQTQQLDELKEQYLQLVQSSAQQG